MKSLVKFDGQTRVVSIMNVDCVEVRDARNKASKHCDKVEFVLLNLQGQYTFSLSKWTDLVSHLG